MSTLRTVAIATIVAVAAGALVNTQSASAGTAERGKYVEPYDDTFNACGTMVEASGTIAGHYVGQLRGDDPVPFYVDHFVDRTTYTNLGTHRSYTTVNRVTHLDRSFEQIDETTIRITFQEPGTFTVYDGNGALYYRQAGQQRYDIVIDTKGTEDDEDDVVLDFNYETHGHFVDNDFCADVEALTT